MSSLPTCCGFGLAAPPLQFCFSRHRGSIRSVSQATQTAMPRSQVSPQRNASWSLSRHVCLRSQALGGPMRLSLIIHCSLATPFCNAPRLTERQLLSKSGNPELCLSLNHQHCQLPLLPSPPLCPPPRPPPLRAFSEVGFVSSLSVTQSTVSPTISSPKGEVVPG